MHCVFALLESLLLHLIVQYTRVKFLGLVTIVFIEVSGDFSYVSHINCSFYYALLKGAFIAVAFIVTMTNKTS